MSSELDAEKVMEVRASRSYGLWLVVICGLLLLVSSWQFAVLVGQGMRGDQSNNIGGVILSLVGIGLGAVMLRCGNISARLYTDRLEITNLCRTRTLLLKEIKGVFKPGWLGDDIQPTRCLITNSNAVVFLPSGGDWDVLLKQIQEVGDIPEIWQRYS